MVLDFLELETWSELVAFASAVTAWTSLESGSDGPVPGVTSDPPLALSFLAAEISEYNYYD